MAETPRHRMVAVFAAMGIGALWVASASADRIPNKTAVFAALDKVTARISKLEVPLDQTVQFGALKVTARSCFTRPPTEAPKTTAPETAAPAPQRELRPHW